MAWNGRAPRLPPQFRQPFAAGLLESGSASESTGSQPSTANIGATPLLQKPRLLSSVPPCSHTKKGRAWERQTGHHEHPTQRARSNPTCAELQMLLLLLLLLLLRRHVVGTPSTHFTAASHRTL